MNINQRLERCERRVPMLRSWDFDASPTDRAVAAVAAGRWDWDHLEILSGGKTKLEEIRSELIGTARVVRDQRLAGEPVVLGDPYSLGALILSYKPIETVSPALAPLLDKHLKQLNGTSPDEERFAYGLAAGQVKLILQTADAMHLRRQLWNVNGAQTG
ncbi:MAG TPA: hypothetical protein VM282_09600 [Acidimicrobiales bacterium]|nr:hypothetical protein [Acidimicrobiales bacterium]